LDEFSDFLQQYPRAPLCVDYNRSFAPLIKKIKKIIEKRNTPLMIHYRMNAGFIPKEHWVKTDIGAGRVIGEACHIIDLFCYLTDSDPVSVSVEALHTTREDLFPTDNFSVQFSFLDGSVCSLFYTALGDKQLGKERMELFFDSKSLIMNDYKALCGFGFKHSIDEVAQYADKGHQNLMYEFFAAVREKDFVPPISFDRLTRVARLTLIVDQLACQGGGNKELII
jgi:predicted dehydrogenase